MLHITFACYDMSDPQMLFGLKNYVSQSLYLQHSDYQTLQR